MKYSYEGRSIIYLPKQERRQWADWNKSMHVGTCLEVSHMQPQLSAILTEWQHVKWACVWALSRRAAPLWQRASAHVCKISSCHSAMWVPTAKSPTLQSRPSSLGLFSIPSYEKILWGKRFSSDEEVKEAVTTRFEEQSKDFFPRGIKSLQQKWAKCIELLGDYIEK